MEEKASRERADRILAAANAMREYGGSFAAAIGTALICADSGNRAKLEAAFPELIERYSKEFA